MNDTGRLIERVGERAPFPDDAFERMLGRRHRKQRNQRVAAAAVGIAVFVAVVALALGAFQRSAPVPIAPPTVDPGTVTFWGTSESPISVNGVPVDGQMSNTPEEVFLYRFSPTVGVPAGAQIVMGDGRDSSEFSGGWIDAWWDGSTPGERLYELDLDGTPTMPTEPGVYTVEFTVPNGPDEGYETFHLLFPIRVVAPEEIGLAFSFDPYDVTSMVWVNGVPLPGEMNSSESAYVFAPDRTIEVATGTHVTVEGADVLDDFADEAHGWIDDCCETSTFPRRLADLDLAGGASMPNKPGTYFVEFRWTCQTCDEEDGVPFLFPVRVVAPAE